MPSIDSLRALADPKAPYHRKCEQADDFSRQFGWRPNDICIVPNALPATNLIVEAGLQDAAMLSFLPPDRCIRELDPHEQLATIGLSYNSLVDWHIWIDQESVHYYYNLTKDQRPAFVGEITASSDYSTLKKQTFNQAIQEAPSPNLPSLDAALLETIYSWKRILSQELGDALSTTSLSALFNALILARAVEDFHSQTATNEPLPNLKAVLKDDNTSLAKAIESVVSARTSRTIPSILYQRDELLIYAQLERSTILALVDEFYQRQDVPYAYDFSLITKQALSKLYERYVSVMHHDEPIQFSLFPMDREEAWNRQLGGIYTPHYIASFFARYLQKQFSPSDFGKISVVDPACGSGVFLRAVLELQYSAHLSDPQLSPMPNVNSLFGLDIDHNAVAVARLSLALLHLAAVRELPEELSIEHGDALEVFNPSNGDQDLTYDAVMANPPFVRRERQSENLRQEVTSHVASIVKGKSDTYIAFLISSIRTLKPGGYGFFVVPQPLLTSDNLRPLRKWIQELAWIHVIADLSAISVFKADVYVALLVVQRKAEKMLGPPSVTSIRCQREVGMALEEALDGIERKTPSYSIYRSSQKDLTRSTWSIATPAETHLLDVLEALPKLSSVALVRQGVITGADSVFVLRKNEIPDDEKAIYRPLLSHRQIGQYLLPPTTSGPRHVFYPYIGGQPVTKAQLIEEFPKTWSRLEAHRKILVNRRSFKKTDSDWWHPSRMRNPSELLAPKIVTPEVILSPRFAADILGKWIVSHSPFIVPKARYASIETLLLLTAILNSNVVAWYIDLNARKFKHGYNKLGVGLLRNIPIPNLERVASTRIRQISMLVRQLTKPAQEYDVHAIEELNSLVFKELYQLDDTASAMIDVQTLME